MKRTDILILDYGAYQFTADLAAEFARDRTVVVSYRYPSPVPTPNSRDVLIDPKLLDAQPVELGRAFERYGWRRVFSEIDLAMRMLIAVLRLRPRNVISANMPILAQFTIWLGTKVVGGRFVFWLQDIFGVAGKTLSHGSPILARVTGAAGGVERFLLRRADAVIAISPDFVAWLLSIGVDATRILMQPNWSDPIRISPCRRTKALDVFGPGGRVFLYTGTVGLKHDVDLLSGLAVHLQGAGARLIVISEGRGADVLRGSAAVTVLPFQDAGLHTTMLASADVLVVSLRSQAGEFSVPSKVNAYLCAGRPVLAALPEANMAAQILVGVGCSVSSPKDPAGFFVAALQLAGAESTVLDRTGQQCRDYAVREFDIERISSRLMSVTTCAGVGTDAVTEGSAARATPVTVTKWIGYGMGARSARHADRLRKVKRAASKRSYRSALLHGVLAGSEHERALAGLSFDAVIDVGANRGQFSLVARQLFGCQIVAIEPLPGPAAVFRKLLADSAVLYECAVGRVEGELEIFETSDDDSSSLLQPGEGQLQLSAGSSIAGKRLVRVRTLDEVTKQLGASNVLLKLDVQGFEMEVLAGATRLLTDQVSHVYVEASFVELYLGQGLAHEVIRYLDDHGFSLQAISNPTMAAGQVLQADFLFAYRRSRGMADLPHEAT